MFKKKTPLIDESESRRLPDLPSQRVGDSGRVGESATPRLAEFLDYEYLREYEAQIGMAQNVV